MRTAGVLGTLAIAALLAVPAHANLIANGDFEGLTCNQPVLGFCVNMVPTGWTLDFGNVDTVTSMWQETNGSQSIDLNGNMAGGLSQTFATVVGVTYVVSFDMSGNPFGDNQGADPIKTMNVLISGSPIHNFSFDTSVLPLVFGTYMNWTTHTFTFTADASTTTIEFDSLTSGNSDCCWGPTLDNVSVVSLPEPGSLLLIGPALIGGLALLKRRSGR